jgi:hypothetical protein
LVDALQEKLKKEFQIASEKKEESQHALNKLTVQQKNNQDDLNELNLEINMEEVLFFSFKMKVFTSCMFFRVP